MFPNGPRAALALALALALGACTEDRPAPTAPVAAPAALESSGGTERSRAEALARMLARGLGSPELRSALRQALEGSRMPEGKLQFQRLLAVPGSPVLDGLARANGVPEAEVRTAAAAAIPLELYFPVDEHRAAWRGGADVLVATAFTDADPPVAFDPLGRRQVLSAAGPPPTPVLALVPVETDFDRRDGHLAECADSECAGGGDGGGTAGDRSLPSLANQHLLLTFSQFREKFEGWLKGDPEFELHVLAPNGKDTTAYKSLQCVGEHAPSGYYWDTNATTWYGQATVFTGSQMDWHESQWPGKPWMIMALEDDDTACEIKMNRDLVGDVLEQLDDLYQHYKGLKDRKILTPEGVKRLVGAGATTANVLTALASLIKTNDELIGFAIRDSVAVMSHQVGNYAVLRDGRVNGWLKLEVKY